MTTIRLTMAQALIRYLAAQTSEVDGREAPLFGGVFAIFGHGNVAGVGEAEFYAGLREAVESHLLVVDHTGRSYAFRHALTRDAVYEDMLPGERVRLHAAYGAALERDPALAGRPWTREVVATAAEEMARAGTPMSDHRASEAYRIAMLRNSLLKFYMETHEVEGKARS